MFKKDSDGASLTFLHLCSLNIRHCLRIEKVRYKVQDKWCLLTRHVNPSFSNPGGHPA